MSNEEQLQTETATVDTATDVTVTEKKSGMGAAGVIGGVAGAVGLGGLADNRYTKGFARKTLKGDALAKIDEEIKKARESNAEQSKIDALVKKREEIEKTLETDKKVVADVLQGEKAKKVLTAEASKLGGSINGIGLIEGYPEHIDNVAFEKAGAKVTPNAEHFEAITKEAELAGVKLEDKVKTIGLHDAKFEGEKLVGGHYKVPGQLPKGITKDTVLKGDDIATKLKTLATDAEKGSKTFIESAGEALKKSSIEANVKAFTKEAKIGTGFKRGGGMGKGMVVAGVVAGGVVGAKVFHAIFGGKHTTKVEAGQDQQIGAARA